jgi:integrase
MTCCQGATVARIDLPFVNGILGRDSRFRYYFRKRGCKNVRLPGIPGSAEFMEAYRAATGQAEPVVIGLSRAKAGTVAAIVGKYLASAGFANLADETRRTRRNILERFREQYGDRQAATLRREHVQAMVDAKADTPSAARNLLNMLRVLMQFAIKAKIRTDDPTVGVTRAKIETNGYITWEEHHIATFEARHPIGSRARLALALLLGTGQRRSDIVTMGRQHVRGDKISVKQRKTGKALMIPMGDELRAAIEATPADHLTFLTTARGRPFTAAGFTNWFRDMCNGAGLPNGLSAHGLRKAVCRRLAEAGCSANEIAAISGHKTLRVQRYTEAVDQERMARAAIRRLEGSIGNDSVTNFSGGDTNSRDLRNDFNGTKIAVVGAQGLEPWTR